MNDREPHWLGADRSGGPLFAPCGVCGETRDLSKTHVPPAAAGNDGKRYREKIQDGVRGPGTPKDGGLWVRGLCQDCNSNAGGLYDFAYVQFSQRMSTAMASRLLLPDRHNVPAIPVSPGPVARSVLYSMFALWLRLRHYAPELAAGLVKGEHPLQLPPQYRLRFAGYRGRPVVESLTFAAHVMAMTDKPYNVVAAFYFPPFAWALTHGDDELLDADGWGDATDWIRFNPEATRLDLRHVLDRFGVVGRAPDGFGANGMEMSGDEHLLLRGV